MPYYMYVALQADDEISVLAIDPRTGKLTLQVKVSVPGGPFTMAISRIGSSSTLDAAMLRG